VSPTKRLFLRATIGGHKTCPPIAGRYGPVTAPIWQTAVSATPYRGNDETLDTLRQHGGLAGHAFWISGETGTGKTTIARLIAQEVAEPWAVQEYASAAALCKAEQDFIERNYGFRSLGKGVAYILNEAHGLNKKQVEALLGLTENAPPWVTWIFTTTVKGQKKLFEGVDDADPLMSRCVLLPWSNDLSMSFAIKAREIAQAEDLDGAPLGDYIALAKRHKCNLRAMLHAIGSGCMATG